MCHRAWHRGHRGRKRDEVVWSDGRRNPGMWTQGDVEAQAIHPRSAIPLHRLSTFPTYTSLHIGTVYACVTPFIRSCPYNGSHERNYERRRAHPEPIHHSNPHRTQTACRRQDPHQDFREGFGRHAAHGHSRQRAEPVRPHHHPRCASRRSGRRVPRPRGARRTVHRERAGLPRRPRHRARHRRAEEPARPRDGPRADDPDEHRARYLDRHVAGWFPHRPGAVGRGLRRRARPARQLESGH